MLTYVITSPCIGVKDAACVDACTVMPYTMAEKPT